MQSSFLSTRSDFAISIDWTAHYLPFSEKITAIARYYFSFLSDANEGRLGRPLLNFERVSAHVRKEVTATRVPHILFWSNIDGSGLQGGYYDLLEDLVRFFKSEEKTTLILPLATTSFFLYYLFPEAHLVSLIIDKKRKALCFLDSKGHYPKYLYLRDVRTTSSCSPYSVHNFVEKIVERLKSQNIDVGDYSFHYLANSTQKPRDCVAAVAVMEEEWIEWEDEDVDGLFQEFFSSYAKVDALRRLVETE